jgi:hypothetical protein
MLNLKEPTRLRVGSPLLSTRLMMPAMMGVMLRAKG